MRTEDRWQMRSAHGPVQLTIHPASTRSSLLGPVPERSRRQNGAGAAVGYVDGEHLGVIADDCSGVDRFGQPFCDQALGEFTLCVFVVENRPLVAGVEGALHALEFHLTEVVRFLPGEALVDPQSGAHFHGAAMAGLIQQKKKLNGMDQVGTLAQQAFPFADRFPHQIDLTVLQVAQSAVNDSGGTAGNAGREVILLD